jgi:hypothetical protein
MANDSITRNPRSDAPVIGMDLRRPDEEIHRDLRVRWPSVIDLWWELEEDERSGWVWSHNRVLAKLVQS